MKITKPIILTILLFIPLTLVASGEPFEHSPRAVGMQDAVSALCDDASIININPSGTSALQKSAFAFSYSRLNTEFNIFNFTYVQRAKPVAFGFNAHINSLSDGFEQLDSIGNSLTSLGKYSKQKYTVNFSSAFSKIFHMGINYLYTSENISSESYSTSSLDTGLFLKPADWFGFSTVVNNILISDETELKTGFAFTLVTSEDGKPTRTEGGNPQAPPQPIGGYGAGPSADAHNTEDEITEKLEKQIDKDLDLIFTQTFRKMKGTTGNLSTGGKLDFEVDMVYSFGKENFSTATGGLELWFSQNVGLRAGLEYSIYYNSINFGLGFSAGVGPARVDYSFSVNSMFMSHFVGIQFQY